MKWVNKGILLGVILVLLLGCAMKDNITGGVVVDFSDKVDVLNVSWNMECAGDEDEPCTAVITFAVLENFVAEPKKMIQIDKSEAARVMVPEGNYTFETKYVYTLHYEVYKLNPTDDITWSWGPIK